LRLCKREDLIGKAPYCLIDDGMHKNIDRVVASKPPKNKKDTGKRNKGQQKRNHGKKS
jgi:hypothetical protein